MIAGRPGSRRAAFLLACPLVLALGAARAADAGRVPAGYVGTWAAGGRCSDPQARLVITATTAALGTSPPAPVVYDANDAGPGRGALHWAAEYDVDNFVLVRPGGPLIHNAEGYGMPGAVGYAKCPAGAPR